MPRKHLESKEQQALFKWAALASGTIPQLRNLFAIPNGGKRDVREAARLKREGVKAGVPDIFLAHHGWWEDQFQCGLFIEMKATKGKQSPEQKEWATRLKRDRYAVAVCRSWIEAQEAILDYLGIRK